MKEFVKRKYIKVFKWFLLRIETRAFKKGKIGIDIHESFALNSFKNSSPFTYVHQSTKLLGFMEIKTKATPISGRKVS